ncbi:MAG: two-component system response regulator [Rariglobus sp.]|jgi:DNA-binding response OmpR family regulator|nr:two-component system response regulator [Rariglobus sp.]
MTKLILLVEDDENDVFLLTRALKKAGIENSLQVADDGRQALDYVEGCGRFSNRAEFPLPYLVLLDLKLPQVKGLDVLKRIRELAGRSLIVVVLSASSNETDIAEAYRLGANAYLCKPANFEGLVEMVRAINDFWLKFNLSYGVNNSPAPTADGAL